MKEQLEAVAKKLNARFYIHKPSAFDHAYSFVSGSRVTTLVVYDTFAHIVGDKDGTVMNLIAGVLDVPIVQV